MKRAVRKAIYELAVGVVCGLVLLIPIFLIVLEIV